MGLDQPLHQLHMLRSDVGERLVKNAEFRVGVQHHIHLGNSHLSPGQLTDRQSLLCMELVLKCNKSVIINSIKRVCLPESHIARDKYILRTELDRFADMSVLGCRLIIETNEDILRLYATHDAFEQT